MRTTTMTMTRTTATTTTTTTIVRRMKNQRRKRVVRCWWSSFVVLLLFLCASSLGAAAAAEKEKATTETTTTAAVVVQRLHDNNYDRLTIGKSVLFKISDPSKCTKCTKKLDDLWTKLAAAYDGHEFVLIGDVDCGRDDQDSEELCEDNYEYEESGSGGLAVYSGDPDLVQLYEGQVNFEALSAHVNANLTQPRCTAVTPKYCTETEQQIIAHLSTMTGLELKSLMEEAADEMEELESGYMQTFQDKVAAGGDVSEVAAELHGTSQEIMERFNYKFARQLVIQKVVHVQEKHGEYDIPIDPNEMSDNEDDEEEEEGEEGMDEESYSSYRDKGDL